jgi:hypothetical protein
MRALLHKPIALAALSAGADERDAPHIQRATSHLNPSPRMVSVIRQGAER